MSYQIYNTICWSDQLTLLLLSFSIATLGCLLGGDHDVKTHWIGGETTGLITSIRGCLGASRISYERSIGRDLWPKIEARWKRTDELTSDEIVELSQLMVFRHSMGDDAWFARVGQVANECPAEVPKNERLEWVASELYRRGAEC